MDLRKCLLTKNECYQNGNKITPKGVMWHSTGANNPNLGRYLPNLDGKLDANKYGNHWNQLRPNGRQVCVHAFIGLDKNDKVCTYQTLPWNYRGWHAGGNANNSYIGFEICEDALTDKTYFNKVYKEAVQLTAYLCKLYNLNPKGKNVIICHKDGYKLGIATNHSDVYHWFNKHGKTMDDVRNDVYAEMHKDDKPAVTEPKLETYSGYVKVIYGGSDGLAIHNKPSWDDNTISGIVKKNEVYTIVGRIKVDGTYMYKLKSGAYITTSTKYVEYMKTLPTTKTTTSTAKPKTIKVGSKVKINLTAKKYATGQNIPLWVKASKYTVKEVNGDKVLLKEIMSWVYTKDVKAV
jgi:N-acetylmuramoyl-L-alanine amidase